MAAEYVFTQEEDSLGVTFSVPVGTTKKDLDITFKGGVVIARVKNSPPIIAGTLFDNPEETLWGFEQAKLTVTIEIEKRGFWPVLVKAPTPDGQIDPVSQNLIGELLEAQGKLDEALLQYREAADRGSLGARVKMGNVYLNGRQSGFPVDADIQTALQYWHAAAEENKSLQLQLQLARAYMDGRWQVPRSSEQAAKLFRLAAEVNNSSEAYHNLGVLYKKGEGVPQDQAAAFRCWKKAADANYPLSIFNVAVAYLHGTGVAPNPSEARRQFERARLLDPSLQIPPALEELFSRQEKEEEEEGAQHASSTSPRAVTRQAVNNNSKSKGGLRASSSSSSSSSSSGGGGGTSSSSSSSKGGHHHLRRSGSDEGGKSEGGAEHTQEEKPKEHWFWKAAGVVAIVGVLAAFTLHQVQKTT